MQGLAFDEKKGGEGRGGEDRRGEGKGEEERRSLIALVKIVSARLEKLFLQGLIPLLLSTTGTTPADLLPVGQLFSQ